jgi:hypothetical protein
MQTRKLGNSNLELEFRLRQQRARNWEAVITAKK